MNSLKSRRRTISKKKRSIQEISKREEVKLATRRTKSNVVVVVFVYY